MAHSSRTLMGIKTRIVGAIAALSATFAAFATPAANAVSDASVTVSKPQLQKVDTNGKALPGQIHEGDILALTFNWAGDQPTSGDRMSIKLPSYLTSLETSRSESFAFTRNGVSTSIGDCRFEQQAVNCAFNQGIDEVRTQGFVKPSGTIKVLLRATRAAQSSAGHFIVNGKKVAAQIPGGKIQAKPQANYKPLEFSMASGGLSAKSKVVPWTINFGSDYVSKTLASSGIALPLDGKTKSSLTITSQLGAGQSFVTSRGAWVLTQTSSAQSPGSSQRVLLTDSSGRDHTKKHGDFDLSVTYEAGQAKLVATGPWAPGTNYSLNYAATFNDAKVTPGFQYTSSARIEGTSVAARSSRTYTSPFASSVNLQSNFGSFEVGAILGEQASVVPNGTVLPVTVEYALPGGATVDGYPGWQAPGSVARSKTGGVATMDVVVGQKMSFPTALPAGTQVRLAIDHTRLSSYARLQSWQFSVAKKTTSKLTIASKSTTHVSIVRASGTASGSGSAQGSAGGSGQGSEHASGQGSAQASGSPQAEQTPAPTAHAAQPEEPATQAPTAQTPAQTTPSRQSPTQAPSQQAPSQGPTAAPTAIEAPPEQTPKPQATQAPQSTPTPKASPTPEVTPSPKASPDAGGKQDEPSDRTPGRPDNGENGESPKDKDDEDRRALTPSDKDRTPGSPEPSTPAPSPTQPPSDQGPSEDDDRIPLSPGGSKSQDPDSGQAEQPDGSGRDSGNSPDQPGSDQRPDPNDAAGGTIQQPSDSGDSSSASGSNADSQGNEASISAGTADGADAAGNPADQTSAGELSAQEALGVESEDDFLTRSEDFPFSDDSSRRGSANADSDVKLDLKPLPTVRSKANDGRILSTGMGMSAGVIIAIVLGLFGSALVLRRYFE